jgi:hypothetical protein
MEDTPGSGLSTASGAESSIAVSRGVAVVVIAIISGGRKLPRVQPGAILKDPVGNIRIVQRGMIAKLSDLSVDCIATD